MKKMKVFLCMVLCLIMCVSLCAVVSAEESIIIDTVTVTEYKDEQGNVDEDLVNVIVEFTITDPDREMTLLCATEKITEINANTIPKILYIDQTVVPEETTYVFPIEKAKIVAATGLDDIEGCTLYVMMGAEEVNVSASMAVKYYDPTLASHYGDVTGDGTVDTGDVIQILRYEVALRDFDDYQKKVADVTGDGEIDTGDAIQILRFDAGLIESFR